MNGVGHLLLLIALSCMASNNLARGKLMSTRPLIMYFGFLEVAWKNAMSFRAEKSLFIALIDCVCDGFRQWFGLSPSSSPYFP